MNIEKYSRITHNEFNGHALQKMTIRLIADGSNKNGYLCSQIQRQ